MQVICRKAAVGALCALFLIAAPTGSQAARPRSSASEEKQARAEAVAAIPYDELSEQDAERVADVVEHATLFRRLPTQIIRSDPRLFRYLIEHPDVTVNLWNVLDVSDISVVRAEDGHFDADDRQGTTGTMEYLYSGERVHLVYASGMYEGPLFRNKVRAECVVVLQSGSVQEESGDWYVTCRLDTFVRFDSASSKFLAKAFEPLVGRVIDYNFLESLKFVSSMNRAAEVNPASAQALANKLESISAEDKEGLKQRLANVGKPEPTPASETAVADASTAEVSEPGMPPMRTARRRDSSPRE